MCSLWHISLFAFLAIVQISARRGKRGGLFRLLSALGVNSQNMMCWILHYNFETNVSLAITERFSRALGDANVLNKLREPYKSQGYCQDRARTFHLPRDSAVVHFNGSGAVLHHLLVQASGVFVKCCVSCLIPRWNQTGNTESICLWRKGTTVVHKRETESRSTASSTPSELLHVENTDSTNNKSKYTKFHSLRKGPIGDVGALHCFQNKLFPRNLLRFIRSN